MIVVVAGIMFSSCLSVCPILVNLISQERLEGIKIWLKRAFELEEELIRICGSKGKVSVNSQKMFLAITP